MIVARQVFQAKYGRGDALVALFKGFNERLAEEEGISPFRILTDASGPFFTVVTEVEVASFAEWEGEFSKLMARPWMGEFFGNMVELVESGRRDFYTVVE
ncbi:MAG: hypothetical protein KF883_12350 [Thermomicrobiales bacterium]|nr:hypothetical protein [Thermomicrobiales bacterium]